MLHTMEGLAELTANPPHSETQVEGAAPVSSTS